MFPLIAIGGAISAIMSVAKGASWLSDQIGSPNSAEATATSGKQSQTADSASFEKTLAAQGAGQSVPTTATNAAPAAAPTAAAAPATALAPVGMLTATHGTDYTSLAWMQAGIAAYGSVGEYSGHHSGQASPPASGDNTTAPVAGIAPQYGSFAGINTQSQYGPGSMTSF